MTLVEIAKLAGVSIGTVDRVLHNRGRVSPKTKERVEEIIQEFGYQPNPLARHLKRNRVYRIGVLIPRQGTESGYWKLIHDGIRKAADELSAFSFEIDVFDFIRPQGESLTRAFNRMLKSDCCAYIIAPVMEQNMLKLLSAQPMTEPYAFIDCPLPGADPITTVAQDPFRGGYLAGKLMDLISHSDGPFAVVRPYAKAFNLNERARGFNEWFASRKNVKVLNIACPERRIAEIAAVMGKTLQKTPDLKGIFIVSSIGHKIAMHISDTGLKDQIKVIAYDLVEENASCLKAGQIDCIVSQRPEEQGRQALHQIYRKIILDEDCVPQQEIAMDIYFKENLV